MARGGGAQKRGAERRHGNLTRAGDSIGHVRQDIAAFVVKSMPGDSPGSLSEDQYWSVLAFDLKANGIDLGDKKLDGALAVTLTIPR